MAKNYDGIVEFDAGGAHYTMNDEKLVISIPISDLAIKTAPISGSGRTRLVATTHGFMVLPGPNGLKLNLNLTVDNREAV